MKSRTCVSGPHTLIVGASLAGWRAAREVRRLDPTRRITLVGAEPYAPYNRPPLSKEILTAGSDAIDRLMFDLPQSLGIDLVLGETATSLDLATRMVSLRSGRALEFDELVIATGAQARSLPLLNGRPSSFRIRELDDAIALHKRAEESRSVLVIGSGLVGTEAASSLCKMGLQVTVIAPEPPLVRVLGPLSKEAAGRLERNGVRFAEALLEDFESDDHGIRAQLNTGERIEADFVVVAIGAAPATGWFSNTLPVDDGVICDSRMRVKGVDRVVAAGDVARFDHDWLGESVRFEHWTSAGEQAVAAAQALVLGDRAPRFSPVPYFWSDQFGLRIQGVGFPYLATEVVESVRKGPDASLHLFRRGDVVVGAVAVGLPKQFLSARREVTANLSR